MTDMDVPDIAETSSGDNLVDIQPLIKHRKRLTLTNYEWGVSSKGKDCKYGLSAPEIFSALRSDYGDWPRHINGRLFIPPGGKPRWLDQPTKLFGWLASEGMKIDWCDNAIGGVTKSEFHAALQTMSTGHVQFSTLPHFPSKDGYYYPPLELPPSNGAFDRLLAFFSPVDSGLLKAAFMTLFWGGPPGARPAFVFTSKDEDEHGGRGVGKTTLTDVMAELAGGAIDFSPKVTDIEPFKKRVLTSSGERVIRFDNVKSSRLSNGDIEGLITLPQVSGHLMFHGNATIPNDFTYLFTFNDVSFSKDMAQRAIPIKLNRPIYSGDWTAAVFAFLREHRLEIISGIRDAFKRPPIQGIGCLRFGEWTKEVLFRATDNLGIVADIKRFQEDVDDDSDLSEDIGNIIVEQISRYTLTGHGLNGALALEAKGTAFAIRKGLLNRWVSEGLNLKVSNRSISKMIARARLKGYYGERVQEGYPYIIWASAELLAPPAGAWRVTDDKWDALKLSEKAFWHFA